MTLGEARRIIGSLGFPSKMPGTSYGLPAKACITGAKLALVAGSACAICYALRDRSTWTNPRKAQAKRLASIANPLWTAAMIRLLNHLHDKPYIRCDLGYTGVRLQRVGGQRWRKNETGFHRWHDSGDLQSVEHLAAICEVARQTPRIKHWLPTQELGIVARFLRDGGKIPENLVIRVSGIMLDDDARRGWPHTSSVYTKLSPAGSYVCPSMSQDHRCGSCRACWSPEIPHVAYEAH